MKNLIKFLTLIACLVLPAAYAQGYTISDNYWGGTVINSGATSYGDVIGYPNFALDSMDVNVSNSQMTVTLAGNYFKTSEVYSWGPGDLYISTNGWKTMDGLSSGNHPEDKFDSSEGWNYVVSYATGKVYNLNFDSLVYSNTSGHGGGWIYRADQAYQGGYGTEVTQTADIYGVFLNQAGGTLTFTFPIGNFNSNDWQNWGSHWNMQCGNDVIEGGAPIPEPSTMLLFGSGLVGLIGFRRKSRKQTKSNYQK
jgi:hypothetical protein